MSICTEKPCREIEFQQRKICFKKIKIKYKKRGMPEGQRLVSLGQSNLEEKQILLCNIRLDDTASVLLLQEGLLLHRPARCSHSLFI